MQVTIHSTNIIINGLFIFFNKIQLLPPSKSQTNFTQMEVQNSGFCVHLQSLTPNTVIMVVMDCNQTSGCNNGVITSLNIDAVRGHFEALEQI